jgi:transcription antitermination factor NusG
LFPHEGESWFAIHAAPQAEKKVAEHLTYKGYQCFLPLYKSRRKWSDRTKVLELPLFPGYVFCRLREAIIGPIRSTPGIVRVVSFGGKPYPIPESEIEALQQIVRSGADASPYMPFLKVGQKVQVKDGPLSGIVGIVVQMRNQRRLVISLDAVMKSISLNLDAYEVASCPPEGRIAVCGSLMEFAPVRTAA